MVTIILEDSEANHWRIQGCESGIRPGFATSAPRYSARGALPLLSSLLSQLVVLVKPWVNLISFLYAYIYSYLNALPVRTC
jgi:hypothetical protein